MIGLGPVLAAALLIAAVPPAHAAGGPAGLSGLFAEALSQKWPAGRTPAGAGTQAAGDSYVLTAAHVIAGCRHVSVSYAGTTRPVTLVGLDSRLDMALLTGAAAGRHAGSPLAGALDAERPAVPSRRWLHVAAFGQPGHGTGDPVAIAVQEVSLVQGMAEVPLLALAGALVEGTSGSPVLEQDGRSIGMVVGQVRADVGHGVGVRSADLLRFLAYFGLTAATQSSGRTPAQAVLVQCVD